jgi:hypothetical protein
MNTYSRMRASDQDRERAAQMLSDAYAVGRLTRDELEERSAAVYAAGTWGELDDLTADIPIMWEEVSLWSDVVVRRGLRRPDDRRLVWPLLTFALVLGAILASLAQSAVAWTAAVLIPLTLLLPLALRSADRRRRRR